LALREVLTEFSQRQNNLLPSAFRERSIVYLELKIVRLSSQNQHFNRTNLISQLRKSIERTVRFVPKKPL